MIDDLNHVLTLSIVIPVFNERNTIEELLQRVARVELCGIEKEIIVVDDGSSDGTTEWLRDLVRSSGTKRSLAWASQCTDSVPCTIKVMFHENNQGKGAALRRGFREAIGDIILVQDADLEYNPVDFEGLLTPILNNQADVVYGSRFLTQEAPAWTMAGYIGNKLITALSNFYTGLALSDVWTGYKVFRKSVLQSMRLQESGFELELELTSRVAYGQWRIREVPITYVPRTRAEGKKITWRDGIAAIRCMIRYRPGNLTSQKAGIRNLDKLQDS